MVLFPVRGFSRLMRSTAKLVRAVGQAGMGSVPRAKVTAKIARPATARPANRLAPGMPRAGTFSAGSFSYRRGQHAYKVYRPLATRQGQGVAPSLLVMLHGCGQGPDDFAAGTRMNDLARETNLVVLYPAQDVRANRNRCWNWYGLDRHGRGRGEPAWIAALVRSTMRSCGIDRRHVFIAGLSAGGAMAALVAQAYPELFAACGVHSGLAAGTARGAVSALSAMRSGMRRPAEAGARHVPTIVFHGDADTTVHPRHGGHAADAARAGLRPRGRSAETDPPPVTRSGSTASGTRYTQDIYRDAQGRLVAERWQVHGMGHAWSGGSRKGSFTAPAGPDASREMLRFFTQVAG